MDNKDNGFEQNLLFVTKEKTFMHLPSVLARLNQWRLWVLLKEFQPSCFGIDLLPTASIGDIKKVIQHD